MQSKFKNTCLLKNEFSRNYHNHQDLRQDLVLQEKLKTKVINAENGKGMDPANLIKIFN